MKLFKSYIIAKKNLSLIDLFVYLDSILARGSETIFKVGWPNCWSQKRRDSASCLAYMTQEVSEGDVPFSEVGRFFENVVLNVVFWFAVTMSSSQLGKRRFWRNSCHSMPVWSSLLKITSGLISHSRYGTMKVDLIIIVRRKTRNVFSKLTVEPECIVGLACEEFIRKFWALFHKS